MYRTVPDSFAEMMPFDEMSPSARLRGERGAGGVGERRPAAAATIKRPTHVVLPWST